LDTKPLQSELVEASVVAHFRRYYPTYYIKSKGEVDIAYVHQKQFWPVEVKWTEQLGSGDLKQIQVYKNAKTETLHHINSIPIIPLPQAILGIGIDASDRTF